MAKVERIRETLQGNLTSQYAKEREQAGWRVVAVEWEREAAPATAETIGPRQETPFGLRISNDCEYLVEDNDEMQFLLSMMELVIQDISLVKVAEELNRRGFRRRDGSPWGPVAIFNMLPRLIEVTPRIFSSEEWVERRKQMHPVF